MFRQVDIVVNGVADATRICYTDTDYDALIDAIRFEAASYRNLGYEIFVIDHHHPYRAECECVQYLTDHCPTLTFNL